MITCMNAQVVGFSVYQFSCPTRKFSVTKIIFILIIYETMCIYVHVPSDYMFHVLSDYIYIHCNVIKHFIYLCLCPCYYVLHVCMYSHIHVLSD